ncbi:hypothetical protein BCV69DRAFT_287367 [Microstroma glucosiphilum]|uniref:Fe2OG dioxygenase domain-containing protein n=1 Tax=Pseudomicrostroma glucosiphilum TaxID=1684307 RepID=A0A316UDI7_9BASI|nr:hypothetical protein BCV69DRAFT_287367 [Pseudomicrostroma glucosiphilum]PWN21125.1 hypothetical protein BCV69DRAFT_287367 [Pseudomicrostroma glucosiphilum]
MTPQDLEKYRLVIPDDALPRSIRHGDEEASGGFFYIPDFISCDEERYLLEKIEQCPKPKWKVLQNRRLQSWGGQVSSRNVLIPEAMPDWLVHYPPLVHRLAATGCFAKSLHQRPNHCLINEYLPGQGIMPHQDGGAYHATVATISLASHTVLDIYRWADDGEAVDSQHTTRARECDPAFSILQEPRSLLLTTGDAYRMYLHGIAERTREETSHLSRVVNGSSVRDRAIKAKVQAACGPNAGSDLDQYDVLIREKRVSLTFRDVEKVSKGLNALLVKH